MNEIIYRGLKLSSNDCRYYNVIEGSTCSLVEDKTTSTLTLTYTHGSTAGSLSVILGIPRFGKDIEMMPTGLPKRFKEVIVSLNGLKLKKLTAETHVIHIIIVSDSESRVVQNYLGTTIVVSQEDKDNQDFINYLFYSGNLVYLQPFGPKPKCWTIKNFPRITIKDTNLTLSSENSQIYTLRRRFDDYVIRAIDYQDQFICEIRRILDSYGIELVRLNKERTLTSTSYITYQFNQTPLRNLHPGRTEIREKMLEQKLPVEFTLRTTDMKMFFDFKNKYQNVNLLTNFCEFRTTDRYGDRWTAAIKWGTITEDFNHLYQSDDNSNFSYQCQFRAELYFAECIDDRYEFIREIITNIDSEQQ